ncbi:hypothetical protein [Sphingopyxis sp. PAMC25046]|uniref:hypothetical protein n=1 Tax=Sphingopyxis sp. PAMC25046 TaxID=2565556 RepID=UPI001445BB8F|nr:hypothetical protein [Sphingopyxis sp. PAMC25046]
MQVVIDSNRLRSEELRDFLAASPSNHAVLIDFASIEAYKTNPLITIQKSMAVLGEFSPQVLVLKGTGRIARLDSREPDYVQEMIWDEYTRTFPLHAASIPFISLNETNMVESSLMLHEKALDILALQSPEKFREFHEIFAALYSKDDIRNLRKGILTQEMLGTLLETAVVGAAYLLEEECRFHTHDYFDVLNDFAVRQVLARLLLNQRWILDGRPALDDERLLNDQVDSIFVTYATYFNGMMTGDQGSSRLHGELRSLLSTFSKNDEALILPPAYQTPSR